MFNKEYNRCRFKNSTNKQCYKRYFESNKLLENGGILLKGTTKKKINKKAVSLVH